MKTKPVLCPERLRHVPRQFSWIDQRLVRERHIRGRSPEALALYLLLCTVGDAQGLSYYSDATAGNLLGLDAARLRAARDRTGRCRADRLAAAVLPGAGPRCVAVDRRSGHAAGAGPPQRRGAPCRRHPAGSH